MNMFVFAAHYLWQPTDHQDQTHWTPEGRQLPPLQPDIIPDMVENTRVLLRAQSLISNLRSQLTEELDT